MDTHPLFASVATSSSSPRFLEQISDDEFWALATEAARSAPATPASADECLLCVLAEGPCLLPLRLLDEILAPPHHFALFPMAPPWMPGISAWRGEFMAVVDMDAYLFSRPPAFPGRHDEGMLLVTHADDLTLGLFVSSAATTMSVPDEGLTPLEQEAGRFPQLRMQVIQGVTKVHDNDVLVLDMAHMFTDITQAIKNNYSYD